MAEDPSIYDGGWDGPPPPAAAFTKLVRDNTEARAQAQAAAEQRREMTNAVLEDWIIENGLDRRRDVRREEDRRATADLIAACRRKGLLQ